MFWFLMSQNTLSKTTFSEAFSVWTLELKTIQTDWQRLTYKNTVQVQESI